MIPVLSRLPIALAFVVSCTVGSSLATAQVSEKQDQQEATAPKGIHRNRGINGQPETATITDGRTHTRITEQEYRERGYAPEFEKLPVLIVQRVPVRIPAQDHVD